MAKKYIDFAVASVTFVDGYNAKSYHYIVPDELRPKIKAGGYALVAVNDQPKLVKIVTLHNNLERAKSFLVAVYDPKFAKDLEKRATVLEEKIAEILDAKRQLNEMLKAREDEDRYAILKGDPAAEPLLAILRGDLEQAVSAAK